MSVSERVNYQYHHHITYNHVIETANTETQNLLPVKSTERYLLAYMNKYNMLKLLPCPYNFNCKTRSHLLFLAPFTLELYD